VTDSASASRRSSELARRIASAIVMAAAALGAAWIGGLPFVIFWTVAGVIVGVEWAWIAAPDPRSRRRSAQVVALTLGAAGALYGLAVHAALDGWVIAGVLGLGAAATAALAWPAPVAAVGVPYGAAAFIGVILLRNDPVDGLLATLWLFAVVWTTDVAAFAVGKTLGGPKLAPRVSPGKTWSGAIGGALGGSAAGAAVAAWGGATNLWPVALVALLAAIAAEVGDLLESGFKRAFGAKDSGRIIPGHGGLMDRLDGFLVASAIVAAIGVARSGVDAAGQGLLRW
jgi:phosphatidate cytidylyltransferase